MASDDMVLIAFGPMANCTLDLCDLEWSVFRYLPSKAANATFLAAFGLLLSIQVFQGVHYKTWTYMACMAAGCGLELAGYAGRIMLHKNPFDFNAFLINLGKPSVEYKGRPGSHKANNKQYQSLLLLSSSALRFIFN